MNTIDPQASIKAEEAAKMETDLYRHFDAAGNLLYVGISFSAINRFSQHKYGSEWSKKVSITGSLLFPMDCQSVGSIMDFQKG